jgi:hypothetical protein
MPDKYSEKIVDELYLRLTFSGGHTMKRLTISILVLLLLGSFAINDALAQRQKSLHQAIIDGEIEQVKSQLSAGEDVNLKNRMGWTLLHTAIRNRRTEITQLLIEKGADVKARDNSGRTPLHFAVETGQKDVVEQLIAKGAEINVMDSRADNALSLARKNNHTEIVDLLIKHGAQEPNPQELLGDRLYPSTGGPQGAGPNANYTRPAQTAASTGNAGQSSVAADLLAKPDEIKARVKTFDGLEKAVKDVSDKDQNELRQWLQTRYDNRTTLLKAVDKQIEDELDYVRTIAVEESAKKTVEAVDSLRTERRRRSLKVNRELLEQKRDQRQIESASARGRTAGRSTRGRTSARGQTSGADSTDLMYGGGAINIPRGAVFEDEERPTEQLDPQTQEQVRLWLQTTPDNRLELARAIHPQIQAEIGSIRAIAVSENAKKTTAAIDGLLLARKERFDGLVIKIEEERKKLQEAQNLHNRTNNQNQINQQNSLYGGRSTRRTTGTQGGNVQQQNTRSTRTRRR